MTIWDAAEAEDICRSNLPGVHGDSFVDGAVWGAGWAFAIIGMAEAIRGSHPFDVPWRFPCAYCGLPVRSDENHDGYLDREKHASCSNEYYWPTRMLEPSGTGQSQERPAK